MFWSGLGHHYFGVWFHSLTINEIIIPGVIPQIVYGCQLHVLHLNQHQKIVKYISPTAGSFLPASDN